MREEKTYEGKMMATGKENEEIILDWLRTKAKDVIDFREVKLVQRLDVDCGVETIDGEIVLAEIKSDKWIKENGNLLFEFCRINHYAIDHWFYLGWGWRSPAQKIIIRNPETNETFIFVFPELRKFIGEYIGAVGNKLRINITETDKVKTTFNYLIPFEDIRKSKLAYKKFTVI